MTIKNHKSNYFTDSKSILPNGQLIHGCDVMLEITGI